MHQYERLASRRSVPLRRGGGSLVIDRVLRAGSAVTAAALLVTCVRCNRLHVPQDPLRLHPTCANCTATGRRPFAAGGD